MSLIQKYKLEFIFKFKNDSKLSAKVQEKMEQIKEVMSSSTDSKNFKVKVSKDIKLNTNKWHRKRFLTDNEKCKMKINSCLNRYSHITYNEVTLDILKLDFFELDLLNITAYSESGTMGLLLISSEKSSIVVSLTMDFSLRFPDKIAKSKLFPKNRAAMTAVNLVKKLAELLPVSIPEKLPPPMPPSAPPSLL